MRLLIPYRRALVVAIQVPLIVGANYLAFWLRFDGVIPAEHWQLFIQMLPWLVTIRAVIFIPCQLYEGLWRYTSIIDLRNIIAGVFGSTLLFYALVHWGFGLVGYPRSVFLIDSILLIFFMGGIRLSRRVYREITNIKRDKRVLIYGAGDAGEMIVRDMKSNPLYEYEPIGFIDDNPNKGGQRIHGVKVLGNLKALGAIIAEHKPDAILLAMPSAQPATFRKLVRALEPFNVPLKTLPNFRELRDAKVTATQIRNLAIQDLLERAPVDLTQEPLLRLIKGQRVLVTGAGGSIGSELSRQIAGCSPSSLVLVDRYENGLYAVATELSETFQGFAGAPHPIIGDATDSNRMNSIIAEHRPSVVFHAAAHKHVPLMEMSPCEAVKNNILGTQIMAEAAARHGVERFILVSTDKAVNPTSVMGATKRVAEMVIQSMNHNPGCIFAAVRFGNVLGSNGSAVPHFLDQIKSGGPVTVTHAEMRRYFMLIPEAVHLVLHAAALAKGGEIFVLEMGEQIKVLDLVRNLIRLSGFAADEIPITFIGIRPGEKLYEELVGADETVQPSSIRQIHCVEPKNLHEGAALEEQIAELELLANKNDAKAVIEKLCEVVPTYRPDSVRMLEIGVGSETVARAV